MQGWAIVLVFAFDMGTAADSDLPDLSSFDLPDKIRENDRLFYGSSQILTIARLAEVAA